MSLKLIQPPDSEPLTAAEFKSHHRISTSEDDTLIDTIIKNARQYFENETGIKIIEQTWRYSLDCFLPIIMLPFTPVREISSIQYIDTQGTLTTLSTDLYQYDIDSEPARIMPAYGEVWPITRTETFNAVKIEYVVGHTASGSPPDTVEELIEQAILLIGGDMYNNREDSVPFNLYQAPASAKRIISHYRVEHFAM